MHAAHVKPKVPKKHKILYQLFVGDGSMVK